MAGPNIQVLIPLKAVELSVSREEVKSKKGGEE